MIDAWFFSSENIIEFLNIDVNAPIVLSFATYPDVKTYAFCLQCKLAKSSSNFTRGECVPDIFLVPPEPIP